MTLPIIWALVDDRAGNVSQCLAVADALALPYTIKTLRYNRAAGLPNLLLGARLGHLTASSAARIAPPWPDIVIGAGRRTVPVNRHIKSQSRNATMTVQLMWPGRPTTGLDLIAVPVHDRVSKRAGLIETVGAPHGVTIATLAAAKQEWQTSFAPGPGPRLALIVGGDAGRHRFTSKHATDLGHQVTAFAQRLGAHIMATTSRRTSATATVALFAALPDSAEKYGWRPPPAANPYLGMLGHADAIVVTGDSMSMCAEACATGKPVFIFAPPGATGHRHRRFHQILYQSGFAQPFNLTARLDRRRATDQRPLDDAGTVAQAILSQGNWNETAR